MKKLLLILSLAISSTGIAQIKKDNTITAHPVEFKQIVNTLLDAGYVIDKIDSNYYTIKTEYKKLCSNCLPKVSFDIRVKDSSAIIKGQWKSDGGIFAQALMGPGYDVEEMVFDIMVEGSKVPKMAFKEMDRIAKLMSPDVTYSKTK